jgi:1,4-alpha-glucan branching enzyme
MIARDTLAQAATELLAGRLTDPFAVLGPHKSRDKVVVRAFLPGAEQVQAVAPDGDGVLANLSDDTHPGLFVGTLKADRPYRLRIRWPDAVQETEDPYAFGLVLGDLDLHLFSEGSHWELARRFGAHELEFEGVRGVAFSVWAPNARRVSVIGDFNSWDGRRHPMRLRHQAGVWELFVPRLTAGERYKYEIVGWDGRLLPHKADPLARATERPPATASVVAAEPGFAWTDSDWMASRARRQAPDAPISIYEVHPASWVRPEDQPDGVLGWRGLSDRLPAYAAELGFTHIELLPVAEHPFGGSWGYQPLSLFAPSARYGPPEGFAGFVDACHRAGLGVIIDWVPGHFPTDPHGLARFDGTALYEHADPREGFHPDWDTYVYNYGRREVQGFLIASALEWIETYHVDGLRVDAVASMLYRDYSRRAGEWTPNRFGGRENLEAVDFLRRLNGVIAERGRGAIIIAEESTAWPGVTAPPDHGGLGFSFKWNMGWMNDTLGYAGRDPVHRPYHHNELTFGLMYAYAEKFILPLSHDEVVYGKGSLFGRMPGDRWRKFANLRAYLGFMWTHPGKKLLFMGGEIAQPEEWSHDGEIRWDLLGDPDHAGIQRLVSDLNHFYVARPALHASDFDPEGFSWVVVDDRANSVYAYLRRARGEPGALLVVVNMTPVSRPCYRVGAPMPGAWREVINTDASDYGGSGLGNDGRVHTDPEPAHGYGQSLRLVLPPLSALVLEAPA